MSPDPIVLAFDTSAAHCAAALLSGGQILAAREEAMAKGQAERLMPMLEDLLSTAGVSWKDLAAIGVGTGPGSFTGLRIGVAAARGLALGLGIPAIGINRFDAGAFRVPRPCRVIVERRGGTVAWQDFDTGGPLDPPQSGTPDALPPGPAPANPCLPLAVAIAHLTMARLGQAWPRPAPLYLRPADALPARDTSPVILAS